MCASAQSESPSSPSDRSPAVTSASANSNPASSPSLALARAALVATTVVWAINNVIVKKLYRVGLQPGMITAVRFSASALLMLPFARARTLLPALALSVSAFSGNACVALSLARTAAGRTAFFAAMSVALTPFIAARLYGDPITRGMLVSCATCVAGVFFLSRQGILTVGTGAAGASSSTSVAGGAGGGAERALHMLRAWLASRPAHGDVFALAAAVAFAVYTVLLSRTAPKYRARELSACQRLWSALLAAGWAVAEDAMHKPRDAASASSGGGGGSGSKSAVVSLSKLRTLGPWPAGGLAVLALLVVTGAVLQVYGQKSVPSQEASVLYTLNPMWAAVAGFVFLGERFTAEQVLGGALILSGCLAAQHSRARSQRGKPKTEA